jgi:hypothetical protein
VGLDGGSVEFLLLRSRVAMVVGTHTTNSRRRRQFLTAPIDSQPWPDPKRCLFHPSLAPSGLGPP